MVGDSISNLIIGLKNASNAKHTEAVFPYTKLKASILEVLKKEGFIEDFEKKGKDISKKLKVAIKYEDGVPVITDVKRVSKQSKRVYVANKDIRSVKNGYGISVISTPQGVMSDRSARKAKIGGEALFMIW